MQLIQSIRSEWLKTKRSATSWLTLGGGFFIPVILLIAQISRGNSLNSRGPDGWHVYFGDLWQAMSGFLLPMGMMLAVGLLMQIEYRNNTWKQLHTTPQSYATIFTSKFLVLLGITLKFFIYFNVGILLSGIIPALVVSGRMPDQPIPWAFFLERNLHFFITLLPVIGLQFLLSLQFRNFMIPFGTGLALYCGTALSISWNYIFISPFAGSIFNLAVLPPPDWVVPASLALFALSMIVSFVLYANWKEKG